jgi:hypothetical protein
VILTLHGKEKKIHRWWLQEQECDDIRRVLPFVWLLNMMHQYRDLNVAGKQEAINFVKLHKKKKKKLPNGLYMYLMGCHRRSTNSNFLDYKEGPSGLESSKQFCLEVFEMVLSYGILLHRCNIHLGGQY